MPRSTTSTCGFTSAIRSSAVTGEFSVVTSAPAASSTTRSKCERILFVVDREHVNPAQVPESGQCLAALGPRMLTARLHCLGMDDHQGQPHPKRRAFPFAGAGCLYRAAVHFDDVANDRQAQSQAARLAGRARLRLTKSLEDIGQEVRADAHPGVADDDFDVGVHTFEAHLHAPVLRRELHRVRHQIPDDLLQTAWIAGHGAHAGSTKV